MPSAVTPHAPHAAQWPEDRPITIRDLRAADLRASLTAVVEHYVADVTRPGAIRTRAHSYA